MTEFEETARRLCAGRCQNQATHSRVFQRPATASQSRPTDCASAPTSMKPQRSARVYFDI